MSNQRKVYHYSVASDKQNGMGKEELDLCKWVSVKNIRTYSEDGMYQDCLQIHALKPLHQEAVIELKTKMQERLAKEIDANYKYPGWSCEYYSMQGSLADLSIEDLLDDKLRNLGILSIQYGYDINGELVNNLELLDDMVSDEGYADESV